MNDRSRYWEPLNAAELPLNEWLEENRGNDGVKQAATVFTKAGEHAAIWHVIGLVGQVVDRRRRDRWRAVNVAVLAAYFTNTALKFVFNRQRPPTAGVDTPTALSFPSAHAATSAAADRALKGLLPRWLIRPLALALPASRLYFGVHYVTDVIAGWVLGRIVARATLRRWPRPAQQLQKRDED